MLEADQTGDFVDLMGENENAWTQGFTDLFKSILDEMSKFAYSDEVK